MSENAAFTTIASPLPYCASEISKTVPCLNFPPWVVVPNQLPVPSVTKAPLGPDASLRRAPEKCWSWWFLRKRPRRVNRRRQGNLPSNRGRRDYIAINR